MPDYKQYSASRDAAGGRPMPHSKEAEQSVIGAMLLSKDAICAAAEILESGDFFYREYGVLFKAICTLYDEGVDADPVLVNSRVKENFPPEFDVLGLISSLCMAVPSSVNVKSYAKIVSEKAMYRRMITVSLQIAEECYRDPPDAENVVQKAEKGFFDVIQGHVSDDCTPIRKIVISSLRKIEKASMQEGFVTGLSTGFLDLDYVTAGFQPSNLILLAARPSMGKTALALNIAKNIAVDREECAAFFSLEMSKEEISNRLLSLSSHVDSKKIRSGKLSDDDWQFIIDGASLVGDSKLIIDDSPAASTVAGLRSRARKYVLEQGAKIIIIDYIQLMSMGRRTDSRQQEVSDISRSLKTLARELKVPVVVLSQLNRAAEKRDNKRPMLSDLRESGAIEQDADVVMMLYRDEYYNPDTEDKNVAELIIAKQRNGPTGTIKLLWLKEYTQFLDMPRDKTA